MRRPWEAWALVCLLSLSLAACGEERAELQIAIQGETELLRRALYVEATAPRWRRAWTGAEIGTRSSPNHSAPVETPNDGTLRVRAELQDASGAVLTSGEVRLDLRPDWVWGVDIWLASENPTLGCFGCMGYRAFAIPAALRVTPTDSLYMIWGGNSISNPVVF
jgi:hypothetical protein